MILVCTFPNNRLQDQKHLETTGLEGKILQTVESENNDFFPSSSPTLCNPGQSTLGPCPLMPVCEDFVCSVPGIQQSLHKYQSTLF